MISIFMIAYNSLTSTMRAVESLLTRTFEPVRFHLLDNGSQDGTWEWMQALNHKYPTQFEVFHLEQNLGPYSGRKFLYEHSTNIGEYVAIMDNDIEVFFNWDIPVIQFLNSDYRIGVVGAQGFYLEFSGTERKLYPVYPGSHPRRVDILTGFVMIMTKTCWQTVNRITPDFIPGYWHEDDDWCLQVAQHGYQNWVLPDFRLIHYGSQSSSRVPDMLSAKAQQEANNAFQKFWRDNGIIDILGRPYRSLPRVERPEIVLEGAALQSHSLATVNRNLLSSLSRIDDTRNYVWIPIDNREGSPQDYRQGFTMQSHLVKLNPNPSVVIRHSYPPRWGQPNSRLVMIQPWEYGGVPTDWVQQLNQAHQTWVPSTRVKEIYEANNIRNVYIVPNGVDSELYSPDGPKLISSDVFTFLFVGGLIHRKGIDVLLQAYFKAFNNLDPVQLIIRDFGTGTIYNDLNMSEQIDILSALPHAPRIRRIREELTEVQMPALYRSANVLVQPFRAEGFCLPALEAMACGVPPIVTAEAGADDFVDDTVGWKIPSKRQSCQMSDLGWNENKPSYFHEPDLDTLIDLMRWIVNHPEEVKRKGTVSTEIAKKWSWDNSAKYALAALGALS
ncbi:glycosyltransferase [Sulfobacillus thermosulfidooxidans]|uniref:glycosyltransferase n=1 Tax=Sulfobacillus thermosulfidooxidans TaxID=28034 RepID=UPI000409FE2C|nr:glycosyltransferase [Sulfobacillus thermosulfidooxidans]